MIQKTLFQHFILTRFNVRRDGGIEQAPDEAWLAHRFELFEKFCLPSLRAQTCQNFRWLVFFDNATPDFYRAKVDEYTEWSNFQPIYIDRLSVSNLAVVLEPYVQAPYLITTRLDNDDALSKYFVERLQAQFAYQEFEFVNFADGYALDLLRRRLFIRNYTSNPFISLVEQSDNLRTVLCHNHTFLSKIGPIKNLRTEPMWLQIVHGQNLANQLAIWPRSSMSRLKDGFVLPDANLYESASGEQWIPVINIFSRSYRFARAIAREVRRLINSRLAV